MSIARKIIRILQYLSLTILLYYFFQIIGGNFKYHQLKTLLTSIIFFWATLFFLLLSESNKTKSSFKWQAVAGIFMLLVIIYFLFVLYEIFPAENWQKKLLVIIPFACILAIHNQIKIHNQSSRRLAVLINNMLLILNFILLCLPVFEVNFSTTVMVILLSINFLLSLLLILSSNFRLKN